MEVLSPEAGNSLAAKSVQTAWLMSMVHVYGAETDANMWGGKERTQGRLRDIIPSFGFCCVKNLGQFFFLFRRYRKKK